MFTPVSHNVKKNLLFLMSSQLIDTNVVTRSHHEGAYKNSRETPYAGRTNTVYHFHYENISTVKDTLPLESLLWSFCHLSMPEVAC